MKTAHDFKGIPLSASVRSVYRPGKYKPPSSPWKTLLLVAVILAVLIFAAYKIYMLVMTDAPVPVPNKEKTVQEQPKPPAPVQPVKTVPKTVQKPETAPVPQQPIKTVSVVRQDPTRITPADSDQCKAVQDLMKSGKYEEARALIQTQIEKATIGTPFYERLQQYLVICSERLRATGAFSAAAAVYEVKPGDTISTIAKRFKTSPAQIIQASNLKHPNRLKIGQELKIPQNNWTVKIAVGKQKLFIFNNQKLIRIYDLHIADSSGLKTGGSFTIRNENQEWKICGLNISDIRSIRKFVPAGTTVEIEP